MRVRVAVVGSLVLDHVVRVDRFPKPGESVPAHGFGTFPGGKGANQAIAAARLGAEVSIVGCIGRDSAGRALREALEADGVDTSGLIESETPSGAALISIDASGQNCICVAIGANEELRAVPEVQADVVLTQLETHTDASIAAMRSGCPIRILNPAPRVPVSEEIWSLATVVTPNEHEAGFFAGVPVQDLPSAEQAAKWFHDKGAARVAITLGPAGVYASEDGSGRLVPVRKVQAVDTVGAGDAFNGALAVRLASGDDFLRACEYACAVAALSVTRSGAQTGLPTAAEVHAFLQTGVT